MAFAAPAMILSAVVLAIVASHGAARFLAGKTWLADKPNGRSAHRTPTPRSGGVAVFVGWTFAMLALWGLCVLAGRPVAYGGFYAVTLAAFALGLVDDLRALPAKLKLLLQMGVAALFIWLFGALETVPLPFLGEVSLGAFGPVITGFWIVAFMNAYNFMDGANGIATVCAMFVLCALGVAGGGAGAGQWGPPALILALALFGFLPLNFPRARLFLGDGGSQFIGFALAALAVLATKESASLVSPLFAPIALMPFLFDVAFTLVERARRGRDLFAAHNEHVYQLLMRLGRSHASIACLYLALTAFSTSVAIIANALDPRAQLFAAALLAAIFAPAALYVEREAAKKGLLNAPAGEPSPPEAPLTATPPAASATGNLHSIAE